MKKILALFLVILLSFSLFSCGKGVETDYPAAIMVDGTIYYKSIEEVPAEEAENNIIGYTTSYTDKFPKKDGQTNFIRELDLPYAKVDDGIAILIDDVWYLCHPEDK
ncbi:MAG: hypothetical protein IJC91_06855 [Oscillospiraceae bacterium]|nr:hypothetical protein [Oscillospiraceae bacterium]